MIVEKINVGLIGAGRIGKIQRDIIVRFLPQAALKAVSDVCVPELHDWAAELGINRLTADYREILADPKIAAVLICSPTDTHAAYITAAARAGKHIFCEKPVALSYRKAKEALKSVAAAGVRFQIGFNRRFDRNHRAVKEAVSAGVIGAPQIIQITSRDPAPPPAEYIKFSGGIFLDMSIHDFDMARYLSGSEVTEVYAAGSVLVDPAIGAAGDIDTAVITLKFANGAIGVVNNSRKAAYGYDQRVEVFGSRGSAANLNDSPSTAVISTAGGVMSEKPHYFFLERYKDSFVTEIQEFIDAVLNDKETAVSGEDALKPVLIALAAKQSLAENRPVKVSEVEGLAGI